MVISSVTLFTACGNDDDDSQPYSQTPAANIEGTYAGELVASYIHPTTKEEVITKETATVVISQKETYIININLTSPAINKTGLANVSTTSSSYPFCNKSTDASNTFGVTFAGEVKGNACTMQYVIESTQRIGGRPQKIQTTYKFSGNK